MRKKKSRHYSRAKVAAKVEAAIDNGGRLEDLEEEEITDVIDLALLKFEDSTKRHAAAITKCVSEPPPPEDEDDEPATDP